MFRPEDATDVDVRMNSGQGAGLSAGDRPDGGLAGTLAAIGAFGIWALFPVYFKQFGPVVSPWEILLHRVIWSVVFLLGLILLSRRLDRLSALLKRPKAVMALACSALVLGANWATFIWAVTHAQVLQSSLGYYINPLLNVFLGYCFLGERLQPLQWLAVAIAAAGVLISLIGYGQVPWLALMMAGCFGLYGLIRKQVDIDGVTGLMLEVMLMSPVAGIWLMAMSLRGETVFLRAGLSVDLLLVGTGIVTILPLLLFVAAARRLKLATVGLLQYIAPTGHLLSGVWLYGEPFTAADAVTFGCIWAGLALYTADMWLGHRRQRRVEF
jgi:chloramphenicol-sensitive protein RarD